MRGKSNYRWRGLGNWDKGDSITVRVESGRIVLRGNTYPVRAELRRIGAEWDKKAKVWTVSPDQLTRARSQGLNLYEPVPVTATNP